MAQFQRTMNPAFRSSSPQPSTFESHHDPDSALAQDLAHRDVDDIGESSNTSTPRKAMILAPGPSDSTYQAPNAVRQSLQMPEEEELPVVPHNKYPQDGMTQFCRIGPASERSSVASPVRPGSRDSRSEYSNPTSFSSQEPSLGHISPTKSMSDLSQQPPSEEDQKRKSGFFQNKSPFRRKSKSEQEQAPAPATSATNGDSWASPMTRAAAVLDQKASSKAPIYGRTNHRKEPSLTPEPADPRASFQLNVGNNVFDVASPDARRQPAQAPDAEDEVAQALAAVKDLTKQSSVRLPLDRFNKATAPTTRQKPSHIPDRTKDVAPPSYASAPASRLGAPQPAFTSRQMQQTTQSYLDKNKNMFNSTPPSTQGQRPTPQPRPGTRGNEYTPRAPSPQPLRSVSPRPGQGNLPRAASPNPYLNGGGGGTSGASGTSQARPRAQSNSPIKPRGDGYENPRTPYSSSPNYNQMPRAASPQPQYTRNRPVSGGNEMILQQAPENRFDVSPRGQQYQTQQQQYGSQPRGRTGGAPHANARPASHYGVLPGQQMTAPSQQQQHQARSQESRIRSKSAGAGGQQFTREGRAILHFGEFFFPCFCLTLPFPHYR